MRRYTLNTGLGALALLGITSACGTLVVVDRNIAGDDLYYSPVRDVVPAVQATSNGANRYVTDADVAAYDQRVNGYRPAGSVTDGTDTRDFSAMQEYYSNASKKGTSLEEIAEMSDSLGIDYNNYEPADGLWLGGYSGSDYEQSYAERLIKFHGPTISVGYYSPLYDNLRYSGNWNIYVDGAGYAYVTPRWFSTWAYDPWGWDWNWHGYRHWGLHSSWHWDWGYLGYGYGYYNPWYYERFGYHGYCGWYDPWYHHNHYGYNYGYIGGSGHGHHHDYLNNKNYRYGHRPSSTIGGGGREVNNPRRGGSSNGSQHVNTGNGNSGHSASGTTPSQGNKTATARDSYRREYTRPSGARNGQTTGTRTGSSSVRTESASTNKSGSTVTSAPVQHSQTRTAAPRSDGGSSRSTYTESSSRQSSRSYTSSGSNKSGSISSSSSSHSYSPSRSSSSSSSSYRSSGSSHSGSSFSSGSHSSSGGSYSSGGGRSSGGGSSHSSGGGRSGGGRR